MVGVTLTGADERTPVDDLVSLAALGAEIGILYTFDPEGRHRYPCIEWIAETLRTLYRADCSAALHVCGKRARGQLHEGRLNRLLHCTDRLQINGKLEPTELRDLCDNYEDWQIITQYTPDNAALVDVPADNHALLVDASGGLGLLPEKWERPETAKRVGFAGGLTPSNLAEQLPRIAAVAKGDWWVDLESGLRDEADWLSVGKALVTLGVFRSWRERDCEEVI